MGAGSVRPDQARPKVLSWAQTKEAQEVGTVGRGPHTRLWTTYRTVGVGTECTATRRGGDGLEVVGRGGRRGRCGGLFLHLRCAPGCALFVLMPRHVPACPSCHATPSPDGLRPSGTSPAVPACPSGALWRCNTSSTGLEPPPGRGRRVRLGWAGRLSSMRVGAGRGRMSIATWGGGRSTTGVQYSNTTQPPATGHAAAAVAATARLD